MSYLDEAVFDGLAEEDSGLLGLRGMGSDWVQWAQDVRLDAAGQLILWEPTEQDAGSPKPVNPTRALDDVRAIATPSDAVRVASRFGPLRLCRHGLPVEHNFPQRRDLFNLAGVRDPAFDPGFCSPMEYVVVDGSGSLLVPEYAPNPSVVSGVILIPGTTYGEPVGYWLGLAERVRSALRLIWALRNDDLGSRNDWNALWPGVDESRSPEVQTDSPNRDRMRREIAIKHFINELMRFGAARPEVDVADPSNPVRFRSFLFGTLGAQLLGVWTGGYKLAICSFCLEPYQPRRQPKKGQRNSCRKTECRKAAGVLRQRKTRGNPDHESLQTEKE